MVFIVIMSAATAMQMMSAMQMPGAEPHAIRHTTYPMSAYNAKSHEGEPADEAGRQTHRPREGGWCGW